MTGGRVKIPSAPVRHAPPRHLVVENPAYAEWVQEVAKLLHDEAEHPGPVCDDCIHEAREYGKASALPASPEPRP